jgi:(4-(4-[2-(gamma-L-glutamylamino)ethyl]phenoxymethyl)furan-2-yl)methanamine synthase
MAQTIGIDIGGANTKVASANGNARSFYLPLWRKNDLAGLLRRVKNEFRPERVGIVITGELADAFTSKKEGICSIAAAVNSVFSKPCYLNVRGELTQGIAEEDARLYAASNWAASAAFLAKSTNDCVFTDVGSTTCDVIPIQDGKPIARTRDFERLRQYELIYMGVLRTNVATLLHFIDLSGKKYKLSTELFAITADVHRVLGNLNEADYACETPDSQSRNLEACYKRISRVLLCDISELGRENAHKVARQVERAQINELAEALGFQAQEHELRTVVGAGLGEFLIAKAALKAGLEFRLLSQQYGRAISNVFPAFAVAQLVQNA